MIIILGYQLYESHDVQLVEITLIAALETRKCLLLRSQRTVTRYPVANVAATSS